MPPLSLATLRRYCPEAPTPFLEVILRLYHEQKDPEAALQQDIEKAGGALLEYWQPRVWSFTSRVTKKKYYAQAHTDPENFECWREAIEDAEAEELQEREEDDDERYYPLGNRRYEPDDVYQ